MRTATVIQKAHRRQVSLAWTNAWSPETAQTARYKIHKTPKLPYVARPSEIPRLGQDDQREDGTNRARSATIEVRVTDAPFDHIAFECLPTSTHVSILLQHPPTHPNGFRVFTDGERETGRLNHPVIWGCGSVGKKLLATL
jgi:hypothetical protein